MRGRRPMVAVVLWTGCLLAPVAAPAAPPARIAVVTETLGFRHDSIAAARAVLERLDAATPAWRLRFVDGAAALDARELRRTDAVVLLSTSGEIPLPREALRRWLRRGGGLVGFHSAADTLRRWPAWERILGGRFRSHGPVSTEPIHVERRGHPVTRGLPGRFALEDEFYFFEPDPRRRAQVLASWGARRLPLVWARREGRGRVVYDALGHRPETWEAPEQRRLVRQSIRWALRAGR